MAEFDPDDARRIAAMYVGGPIVFYGCKLSEHAIDLIKTVDNYKEIFPKERFAVCPAATMPVLMANSAIGIDFCAESYMPVKKCIASAIRNSDKKGRFSFIGLRHERLNVDSKAADIIADSIVVTTLLYRDGLSEAGFGMMGSNLGEVLLGRMMAGVSLLYRWADRGIYLDRPLKHEGTEVAHRADVKLAESFLCHFVDRDYFTAKQP